MAADFTRAIDKTSVSPGPLQKLTSRNAFPEFYSSSFPIFALTADVSKKDIHEDVDTINEQARSELGFDKAEMAEMGHVVAIPEEWQQHQRNPTDLVRWYHEELDKVGLGSVDEP